ncbi:MAG: DUF5596 domain-containing protein [Lentisphaeria bacterium]|nr:DUF5596 domain-containing protein [Lentisphaeria bacterium]
MNIERQAKPFPGIENISFLQNDYIIRYSTMAGVDENLIAELIRLKDVLLLRDPFVRLIWEFHDLLYEQELPFGEVIPEDPKMARLLGDDLRGVFYYLLILSGLPLMIRRYEERHWPDSVRDELLADLAVWTMHHKRNFGTPGLAWMVMPWFQSHINLKLVAFGRLQFNTSRIYNYATLFLRHRQTGEIQALYAAEKRFTAEGILDDLQEEPSENSWISDWEESADSWKGNPVTPGGLVLKGTKELLKSEWDPVLAPGDSVINIHIPESGPLKQTACRESLLRAREFFAEFLPEYHWKAFFCHSWLLDPQLPGILPPDSNILAFQQAMYLLPTGGEADTIFRCFGVKGARDGVGTVPLRTSLQHAFARFLKAGHRFHYGAAVLLRDDLDRENPYPRHD